MAKARKCDRCQQLYNTYNMSNNELEPNAILFTNLLEDDKYYSRRCLDICPKCMDELKQWFREYDQDINGESIKIDNKIDNEPDNKIED